MSGYEYGAGKCFKGFHTSTALSCSSRGEAGLMSSSSRSFSEIHRKKASDWLPECSHQVCTSSSWLILGKREKIATKNIKSGIKTFLLS